jgi:hypothetical protein
MYDASDRRFMAVDPVKGSLRSPQTMAQYIYVLNNPLKYIDLLGLFLIGTRMSIGAQGENVKMLQEKLIYLGYLDFVSSDGYYNSEVYYNFFGSMTLAAVNKYKNDKGLGNTGANAGVVGAQTWSFLGLPFNTSVQQEFFGSGPNSFTVGSMNFAVKNNEIIIDYFPKFYVQEEYTAYMPLLVNFLTYQIPYTSTRTVSQSDYDDYVNKIVDGFLIWAGNYKVQGVNVKITVNVTPSQVNRAKDADIVVTTNKDAAPWVPTSFFWSRTKEQKGEFNFGWPSYSIAGAVTNTGAHEFGHILGLFDAYGYESHFILGGVVLPEADSTINPKDGIMWSPWNTPPQFYDTEAEMLLYAWSRNALQLYTNSVLGSKSQAFFN